jgi:hypothetical protein
MLFLKLVEAIQAAFQLTPVPALLAGEVLAAGGKRPPRTRASNWARL